MSNIPTFNNFTELKVYADSQFSGGCTTTTLNANLTNEPQVTALQGLLKQNWTKFSEEKKKFIAATQAMDAAKQSGDQAAFTAAKDQYQEAKAWMIDHKESIESIQRAVITGGYMTKPDLPVFKYK